MAQQESLKKQDFSQLPFYHPKAQDTEVVGVLPVQLLLVIVKDPGGKEVPHLAVAAGQQLYVLTDAAAQATQFHDSISQRVLEIAARHNLLPVEPGRAPRTQAEPFETQTGSDGDEKVNIPSVPLGTL